MLSVLTVNIGAASQERARLLLDWLARRPEEVLVITESSAGPGTSMISIIGSIRVSMPRAARA